MERVDILEFREARALVEAALRRGRTDHALLIGIGVAYGLRISDLLALRWRDLLAESGEVKSWVQVREQKTGRIRVCRTPRWLIPLVGAHLKKHGAIDPEAKIFSFSRVRAWQILKEYGKICGLQKRISPHSLRKCFCTAIYQLTRDPVLACQFTGHRSGAALLAYIGYPAPTVARIWEKWARQWGDDGD